MVVIFQNDDTGYSNWLKNNPDGFVLNCDNPPKPNGYRMLHRATCKTIIPDGIRKWTHSYSKVCSLDKNELITWSSKRIGCPPWSGKCL